MTKPSPRRRFQFSLSPLFCITLFVAIWAWGTTIVPPMTEVGIKGGVDEPNIEWFLFTAGVVAGIWVFVRAAVCHQARAIGRGKTDDPLRDASP